MLMHQTVTPPADYRRYKKVLASTTLCVCVSLLTELAQEEIADRRVVRVIALAERISSLIRRFATPVYAPDRCLCAFFCFGS